MNVNFKLRDLLEAGMHLGHKTNKWNPSMDQYIYGVQCGNRDCYACGTQRYNCNELNRLDNKTDVQADLEAQDYDTFGEDKI